MKRTRQTSPIFTMRQPAVSRYALAIVLALPMLAQAQNTPVTGSMLQETPEQRARIEKAARDMEAAQRARLQVQQEAQARAQEQARQQEAARAQQEAQRQAAVRAQQQAQEQAATNAREQARQEVRDRALAQQAQREAQARAQQAQAAQAQAQAASEQAARQSAAQRAAASRAPAGNGAPAPGGSSIVRQVPGPASAQAGLQSRVLPAASESQMQMNSAPAPRTPMPAVVAAPEAPRPVPTAAAPAASVPQAAVQAPAVAAMPPGHGRLTTSPTWSGSTRDGAVTRSALQVQAEGKYAAPAIPTLGATAGASWKRYLDSFNYPIPEHYETTSQPE